MLNLDRRHAIEIVRMRYRNNNLYFAIRRMIHEPDSGVAPFGSIIVQSRDKVAMVFSFVEGDCPKGVFLDWLIDEGIWDGEYFEGERQIRAERTI